MKIVNMLLAVTFLAGVTAVALCQDGGGASRPQGTFGTLVKVDGAKLVIKTMARGAEAKEVTVETNDKTKFTVDGTPDLKITDLKADMRVMVTGSPAGKVVANTPGLGGMVVKVDGKNVVIKTRAAGGEGKEVTVATDEKTKVIVDEKAAKLEDLKADMRVNILPATGTAEKIVATTGGGAGGGRGGDRGNGGGRGGERGGRGNGGGR